MTASCWYYSRNSCADNHSEPHANSAPFWTTAIPMSETDLWAESKINPLLLRAICSHCRIDLKVFYDICLTSSWLEINHVVCKKTKLIILSMLASFLWQQKKITFSGNDKYISMLTFSVLLKTFTNFKLIFTQIIQMNTIVPIPELIHQSPSSHILA